MQQVAKPGEDPKDPKDPAEAVLLHLSRHPCDLIDTQRLMRRFHASAADIQRALSKFEQITPTPAEEPRC